MAGTLERWIDAEAAPQRPTSANADMPLQEFIRGAWHIVEPRMRPYIHGRHIDAICEHLTAVSDGQIQNLIINMPPRYMKSLAVSVFWPCWVWSYCPEMRWLFASYAMAISTRDSVKCRDIMRSSWYRERWSDAWEFKGDQNAKTRYENTATGLRMASAVDSIGTGEGGDIVVIDDPNKIKDTEEKSRPRVDTGARRAAVIDWFDGEMTSRINDPDYGGFVIVQQRAHERDLTGHLLAKDPEKWVHLKLPALYEGEGRGPPNGHGWTDWRTEPEEVLWPERFSRAAVDALAASMDEIRAAGQLQQRPTPREGGIVKLVWLRYYDKPPRPEWFDEIVQSWDMSFKRTSAGSYVAGLVLGRKGPDKFLLDRFHARVDFSDCLDAVRDMSKKWPKAYLKLVEDKANGPAVISALQRELAGLVAVQVEEDKEARMSAASPQIRSGNYWLPSERLAGWMPEYRLELTTFPGSPHDDDVDATSQGLLFLEDSYMAGLGDDTPEYQAPVEEGVFDFMETPDAEAVGY